ncbi:MAG: hypothetical protein BGO39_34300 [Chloroflexi bacterium 54-19]|nr:MAG: hypothetical protein BGO39_34300 [Chloroflexi bacterium 54-19]
MTKAQMRRFQIITSWVSVVTGSFFVAISLFMAIYGGVYFFYGFAVIFSILLIIRIKELVNWQKGIPTRRCKQYYDLPE